MNWTGKACLFTIHNLIKNWNFQIDGASQYFAVYDSDNWSTY